MKTKALAAGAALLLLALTGCSGGAAAASQASQTTSASATPSSTATPQAIIPRVIGKSVDDAAKMLSEKGIKWEAADWNGKTVQDPLGKGLVVTNSMPSELYPAEPGKPVTLIVATPAQASAGAAEPSPSPSATPTPTPTPTKSGTDVTYTVTSDGPIADVTIDNTILWHSDGLEQFAQPGASFTKTYHFDRDVYRPDGDIFVLTASAGDGASTITCTLSRNGYVAAKKTSTGPYATVSCEG